MMGEMDLAKLLSNMSPNLKNEEYIFASVGLDKADAVLKHKPLGTFIEDEGLTVVVEKQIAEELGLFFENTYRCITLQVHSSLQAVGLTAAVSKKLADNAISANVIAGFYHDHIFVPAKDALNAERLLNELG